MTQEVEGLPCTCKALALSWHREYRERWHMPVISAPGEVEVGRSKVQSPP